MEKSANYNCIGKNCLVHAHAPPVHTISFTKESHRTELFTLINCPQNTTLMTKKHRGRIQAQGNGVEKSVTWSQDEPLSREQGKTLLQQLKGSSARRNTPSEPSSLSRPSVTLKGPMEYPPRSGAPFRTAKPEMCGSTLRYWRVGPSLRWHFWWFYILF